MEFKEQPEFSHWVFELLSDEEYAALQDDLQERPESGNLIPGTGGARKIRVAMEGRGKRSGSRVIYYYQAKNTLHMILIYPKNKQENLTPSQEKFVRSIVESIKGGSQ